MNRTYRFAPVALLTFALGAACVAAVYWIRTPSTMADTVCGPSCDGNPEITEPIDRGPIDFCDLARDPEWFNGKTVHFVAKLGANKHGMVLYGLRPCGTSPPWVAAFYFEPNASEIGDYLARVRGRENSFASMEPVEVVATGRFFTIKPSFKSDLNSDTAPLQMEIMQVERASLPR